MAEEKKLTPVSELGEFGLINHIKKQVTLQNKSSELGIGDDAAIIKNEGHTVLTTDLLVEGVHFDLMYSPLKHIGYKAVVVNLSDVYAMNLHPEQITFSMALSSKYTVEAIDELYDGILTACRYYGVDLIGGDTTSSLKGMVISVTALGYGDISRITRRDTASVGDYICVSGDLGAAYLGLQILEREKQVYLENPNILPALDEHQYLIQRQLKPEARKDVINTLEKLEVLPTAMIDISDGLSSDLLHICKASGVGCNIYEEDIPVHDDAVKQALEFNMSPITCALNGGEDYELLFTVGKDDFHKIDGIPGLKVIGEIASEENGCKFEARGGERFDLIAQGWNALLSK